MRKTVLYLSALLLLALAVRLGAMHAVILPRAAVSGFAPFYFPDSAQLWETAANLAGNGVYETADRLRAWRMPLPPLLLAGARAAGVTNPDCARIANILFDVLNVFLLWHLARKMFSPAAGWLAGLAGALYPFHVFLSALILSDTLAHTAVLLMVEALLACRTALADASAGGRPGGWKRPAVWLGLSLGLAALTKASLGLLPVPAGLYLLWQIRRGDIPFRPGVQTLLLSGTVFALALSGWWLRNYRQFGEFVPFSTMGGFTLWESTGPGADGGANHGKVAFPEWYRRGRAVLAAQPGARARDAAGVAVPGAAGGEPLETALDRALRRETAAAARNAPARALRLCWEKFRRTWNPVPNWQGADAWPYKAAMLLGYLPVLLLALAGMAVFYRRRAEICILLLPAFYLAAVHCVFMGSVRYRVPAEGCLIILAAGTLCALFSAKSRAPRD